MLACAERRLTGRTARPSSGQQGNNRLSECPELGARDLAAEPSGTVGVGLDVVRQNQVEPLCLIVTEGELPNFELDVWRGAGIAIALAGAGRLAWTGGPQIEGRQAGQQLLDEHGERLQLFAFNPEPRRGVRTDREQPERTPSWRTYCICLDTRDRAELRLSCRHLLSCLPGYERKR
jgi:hypothetical protein